ncbi:MAG: M1 family metallopeptidase [Gemmatimonadota bacterium]
MKRYLAFLVLAATAAVPGVPVHAQAPPRAVRRDLPLTNTIERAHQAGTRDSTGAPGSAYWQLWLDYDIRTRLDPAAGTVTGQERIVLHNHSPDALEQIVLRLDQNVYGPNVPRSRTLPEITDGMSLTRLMVNGQAVDMTGGSGGRGRNAPPLTRPVISNPTQTVATIRLPDAIPAGGQAILEAEWSFRVPKVASGRGMRMGAWGDSLYQVAQWYPQVAVYDDLRGWNDDPYLGASEFFNAFGSFDLRIDVPAGWIVGATGVLQNPEEVLTATARARLASVLDSDATVAIVTEAERDAGTATAPGERLVWHFRADTVNDVAWAASDRYIWEATRATIPGVGPIPVHLIHTPASAEQYERAAGLTRHALEFYSELWMPYAFPQLTLAEGPEMGMEYPMFLMSGAGAADHEAGHEWWPMMVGTNETWYGFMDEGFNQYMNILSGAHRRGEVPDLDGRGQSYGRTSGDEREGPLMWNANYGGPRYSFQAYSKAPLMLSMLGGIVGDTAVWEAMSDYARAWRFKHPSPWDYAIFMNRALGQDLDWFWYSWLFTTDRVDGSIQAVRSEGGKTLVEVHQAGQMPSPVVLRVEFAPGGPAVRPMANSVLLEDGSALVTYPVDVWFDGARSFLAELDFGGRAVQRVILDPRGRFPDREPSDNVWPREPAGG